MSEELASLEPVEGSLDRACVFSKAGIAEPGVLYSPVEGTLPAADDIILEKDGVFVISDNAHADGIPCDEKFKALVDSIMGN